MDNINAVKNDELVLFYKGKKITINISMELAIDENVINTQLKRSPSNYAFLCLMRDKYIYKRDKLAKVKEDTFATSWIFYKESGNINNDLADKKATIHPKYQSLCERYDKLNYKANMLISICRAYESRERIMQTLSANIRKQS